MKKPRLAKPPVDAELVREIARSIILLRLEKYGITYPPGTVSSCVSAWEAEGRPTDNMHLSAIIEECLAARLAGIN